MADREVLTVRMSKLLVRKIDTLAARRRRELGTDKWSRNDEIVAILEAAAKDTGRE